MKTLKSIVCITLALAALAGCSKPSGPSADDGDGGATPPATASDAASPAAAVADAGSYNPMTQKPGLWQISQTMTSMGGMKVDTKMCVDAAMGDKMATYGINNQVKDTDCSNKSIVRSADGADISMTCVANGRTTDLKMHVKKVSDSEFSESMDARFTPATAGHDSMSMTMDGKWLGACPAGMKGGDVRVDTTGVSMNMYSAMAKLKAAKAN
ncbi:MAG: DUF3617 family protein [Asticcacaulis sp.]